MGTTNNAREINYQENMQKHDECITQAIAKYQAGDYDLATFYYNAAAGYKRRALRA